MNDAPAIETTESIISNVPSSSFVDSSSDLLLPSSSSSSTPTTMTTVTATATVSKAVAESKQLLRHRILTLVRQITPDDRLSQSLRVTESIIRLPEWQTSKCIGIYLSMENELQTHALLRYAFQQQKKILVPKIIGKSYHDMIFYEAWNEEDIANFPKNRWGIPEPPETYPAAVKMMDNDNNQEMTNMRSGTGPQAMPFQNSSLASVRLPRCTAETIQPPLDLLIVPGVAFDRLCWRTGYGKGYYDNFIHKYRSCTSDPVPTTQTANDHASSLICIGISLREQIVECIPHDSYDEQLDMVVTAEQIYRRRNGTTSNTNLV